MTQIAISDEVASSLASEASSRGCSPDELAYQLIEDALRWEENFQLTAAQEARLLRSFAQAERGELIDGEAVMGKLERFLAKTEPK